MTQINFSDSDKLKIELLKGAYTGRPEMYKATRKLILGLPLSDTDKTLVAEIKANTALVEYLKSVLMPEVHGDEEVFMVNDIWFQINLKDKSKEEAIIYMEAVEKSRLFFDKTLNGQEACVKEFKYQSGVEKIENLINVLTRNLIISAVETTLRGIKALAGDEKETIEQLAKRLEKNSTK